MNGYCLSDKYCQYKSNSGYCGYTGAGCVLDNSVTIETPNTPSWSITKAVDISTDSIEAIVEAVAKKLRGEIGGIVRCKDCKYNLDNARQYNDPDPIMTYAWCNTEGFQDNDFCSKGKEKA